MDCREKCHLCWKCRNSTSQFNCSWVVGIEPKGVKRDCENNIVYCPNFVPDKKPRFTMVQEMRIEDLLKLFRISNKTYYRHKYKGDLKEVLQKQKKKYNIDLSGYILE